jgi:4,5-dihydroxyphthalate decarboxylase
MMNISLSLALTSYDHVRDVLSGEVRAQGIELVPLELPIEEIFYRFTRFREWQVSEMSFGKVVALLSEERPDIIALPVFVSRVFRHSAIYRPEGSPIKQPKDLEGRRVGIPEWSQTAGIYVRGMLAHEYGVDLASIQWVQAGVRQPGRIEKVELRLPAGLEIRREAEKTLVGMLAAGELDAVISAREIAAPRLFGDYRAVEAEYWKKTRIFPIMHVLVLKRDVYEAHRWIAMNLFKAFDEARRRSVARVREFGISHLPVPWLPNHVQHWRELAGDDFWPYGVEANRPTLEAFFRYAYEQGVAKTRLRMEDVFAPETREQFRI